jgi:hypothetical protein
MRRTVAGWLLLTCLGLAGPVALGQAQLGLEVESRDIYAGEPFTVALRVENFSSCDPPVFPDLPGCTVRSLGQQESSQTYIVGGRMTSSTRRTYRFELTAREPGELVIPPVTVSVDGRALQTPPVRVNVQPGDAGELFFVEITSDHRRIYVGQRVRLFMTIWVKPVRVQGRDISSSYMRGQLRVINLGPFRGEVESATERRRGPDGSSQTYYTYKTWTEFVADRPGRLSFDEIELGIQYPTELSRDIFGQLYPTAYRNLRASPRVGDIEVLPLPAAGRPANFTGAVGTFDLVVRASPMSVRVGEPIQLTIEIRGDGPLETLPGPNLAADPLLNNGFRVPAEELAGQVSGSRKIFTQMIRPERPDLTEIPSLEYPYFDPDRGLYLVAVSEPIPISVAPAPMLDTGALAERIGVPRDAATADLHVLDGLRGNETREDVLLRSVSPVSLAALAWTTCTPPAAFVLVWAGSLYMRTGGVTRRRRQRALRTARRRLEQARQRPAREAGGAIAAALAGYLAERFNQPVGRMIGPAALDFLAERSGAPELRERWREVLERSERATFGAATEGDTGALVDEAQGCLTALERERL